MEISKYLLSAAIVLIVAPTTYAAVGFVNRTFEAGETLFANPLQASPNNTLSTLFATAPEGTSISLWNSTTRSFDTTSTFATGEWSDNLVLAPGIGAKLTAPSNFTNPFVGEVLNHDGSVFEDTLILPPVFAGPNGFYLLGDKSPITSTGTDIFLNILGRLPDVGEQVQSLRSTSTYLGGGNWDVTPTLNAAEAVFLNVGPVPEPATATLVLVTLLGLSSRDARRVKPWKRIA